MQSLGVAGEERLIKLTYLTITARLLDRSASLIIKGPSSVGKSYPVEVGLKLFPPSAYYVMTGMLAHRTLIIWEATGFESEQQSHFLRTLLSEGRVRYETVEKANGRNRSRLVELAGPTGLITSTCATDLHPENETRALTVMPDDSPQQTQAVMVAQAREPLRPETRAQWFSISAHRRVRLTDGGRSHDLL